MPPVTTAEALHHKVREIAGKAHVDFMLWGGISGNSMADRPWRLDLAEMAAEGAAAIKVYLLSGMDSFTDISPEQLADVMEAAAGSHLPVGVHAEDKAMVGERFERLHREGRDGAHAYAASRPAAVEVAAVKTVLEACRASGAPVHIVHLASGAALDEIAAARAEGWPVTAETCPHYLQFTTDDLARQGSILKTAPVVKDAADRDRLWQGLANGDLETVATDHAPAQWPEEKHTGSFWTDYGGIPGVELLLPYLYSEGVCRGRITLKRLVEVTAEGPARLFGLERRKGRLASGFDADFVVFDEALTWTVRAEALHNRNRYTPLEGETMTGRVRATYVRGRCVYRREVDGAELFGPSGWGRYTPRGAA
jgi:allantoinase